MAHQAAHPGRVHLGQRKRADQRQTHPLGFAPKPRPVNVGGRQSRNAGWLAKGDEIQRFMMAELADYELSLGRRLVEREAVDFLNSHRGKPAGFTSQVQHSCFRGKPRRAF